jgi:hypothetical protein
MGTAGKAMSIDFKHALFSRQKRSFYSFQSKKPHLKVYNPKPFP